MKMPFKRIQGQHPQTRTKRNTSSSCSTSLERNPSLNLIKSSRTFSFLKQFFNHSMILSHFMKSTVSFTFFPVLGSPIKAFRKGFFTVHRFVLRTHALIAKMQQCPFIKLIHGVFLRSILCPDHASLSF